MTEHLKDKDYSHFWSVLNAEWFKWFPEEAVMFPDIPTDSLLAEENIAVDEAKTKHKTKNCSLKKESTVFDDALQPKRRPKSEAKIYSDIYYDKCIKPLVKAEEEVGNLLEDEDDNVKAQVHKMYKRQQRTHEKAAKKNVLDDDEEGGCVLDAEAIMWGVDDLPIICQQFVHLIKKKTASDKHKLEFTVGHEDGVVSQADSDYGKHKECNETFETDNEEEPKGHNETEEAEQQDSSEDGSAGMMDVVLPHPPQPLPVLPYPTTSEGTSNNSIALSAKPSVEPVATKSTTCKAVPKPKAATKPKGHVKSTENHTVSQPSGKPTSAKLSPSGNAASGSTSLTSDSTKTGRRTSKHVPIKSRCFQEKAGKGLVLVQLDRCILYIFLVS
ncbi:uncharacterized protein EDB93DRAFT_1106162 [Suillus bovinus]|uniref:uncharacterized protein n=1 Tax=Suillus bovinus TaxID=48563 RepID=UPI001B866E72|nr:uncharacterized protein EDB93DRAFT_1106162 [Suillus bovinus]KAG2139187.1 hypothetical protein EDB93DRAFT_1106162 [Suillus bovinus]